MDTKKKGTDGSTSRDDDVGVEEDTVKEKRKAESCPWVQVEDTGTEEKKAVDLFSAVEEDNKSIGELVNR